MARTQGSHSDITGPRVRDAALKLFAQHGYTAVSMRKIATEVGVQAGALYNYTPDKQSLLFDLMNAHMQELLASWKAQPKRPAPQDQLEDFTRFHIRFHSKRPDEVFIAYMELRNLSEGNHRKISTLRGFYEAQIEEILQAGKRSGAFDVADPKVASMAVIAMLTGVNTWFHEGGRLSLPDVENLYCDMVRRSVSA